MERTNLEIVQAQIAAFNRDDAEAMLENVAPDFEFDMSRAVGPDNGVYGLDRMVSWNERIQESWESITIEPQQFLERGDDVVVPWTWRVRGRDGIEVEARVTIVVTIRDGVIARACMYQSRQDALDAIGAAE
jgi:ketosteroid isomerase-like protein